MKKILVFVIIVILLFTFLVWSLSQFLLPALDVNVSNSAILFFTIFVILIGVLSQIVPIYNWANEVFKKRALKKRLYALFRFMDSINENSDYETLEKQVDDLIEFVNKLPNGVYYANKISELIPPFPMVYSNDYEHRQASFEHSYRESLHAAKEKIRLLIDQLLEH